MFHLLLELNPKMIRAFESRTIWLSGLLKVRPSSPPAASSPIARCGGKWCDRGTASAASSATLCRGRFCNFDSSIQSTASGTSSHIEPKYSHAGEPSLVNQPFVNSRPNPLKSACAAPTSIDENMMSPWCTSNLRISRNGSRCRPRGGGRPGGEDDDERGEEQLRPGIAARVGLGTRDFETTRGLRRRHRFCTWIELD